MVVKREAHHAARQLPVCMSCQFFISACLLPPVPPSPPSLSHPILPARPLHQESEPAIWDAIRFGAVLENVVFDEEDRVVDYDNRWGPLSGAAAPAAWHRQQGSRPSWPRTLGGAAGDAAAAGALSNPTLPTRDTLQPHPVTPPAHPTPPNPAVSAVTENTRACYPIEHIPSARLPCVGPHPAHIIMLCCDAFGVLPPVARLTKAQAIYYFIRWVGGWGGWGGRWVGGWGRWGRVEELASSSGEGGMWWGIGLVMRREGRGAGS